MSTRHASPGSGPAPERYMSAPQFVELRGLQGNLVAEKSRLYDSAAHREMLFFLHAESLKPGGLRALAARIIAEFPHLLGSKTMRARGMKPGTRYNDADMEKIETELDLNDCERLRARGEGCKSVVESNRRCTVDYLSEICRWKASGRQADFAEEFNGAGLYAQRYADSPGVATLLEEICLNPDVRLDALEDGGWFREAAYIENFWAALAAMKKRAEERDSVASVTTSIGAAMHASLDYALRNRRMVIVEGLAGSGKTTAAESWVRQHPGHARFVSLSGITHRTGFFQKIGTAIGLATCQRKSSELQAKIETFFQLSGLMLVIDEAHYAWPRTKRVTAAPEIIDWINTALVNAGVPVALICTDQFRHYKEQVERQTGWTSEQFMHRCKRYTVLPETPTDDDMRAVATFMLSAEWNEHARRWQPGAVDANARAVAYVVAYAMERQTMKIAAICDAMTEARDIALSDGRCVVTAKDVVHAVDDRQKPSDAALKTAFNARPPVIRKTSAKRTGGGSRAFLSAEMPLPSSLRGSGAPVVSTRHAGDGLALASGGLKAHV